MKNRTLSYMFKIFMYYMGALASVCASGHHIHPPVDVLIVGAGPAGLTLANACHKERISYYLIEQKTAPTHLSQAPHLHPQAVRMLEDLGVHHITDHCRAIRGHITEIDNKEVEHIDFPCHLDGDIVRTISQATLERTLSLALPFWKLFYGYELKDISQTEYSVVSTVRDISKQQNHQFTSRYLVGADGANSFVRQLCGFVFQPHTPPQCAFSFEARLDHANKTLQGAYMYTLANTYGAVTLTPIDDAYHKVSGTFLRDQTTQDIQAKDLLNVVHKRAPHVVFDPKSVKGASVYNTQVCVSNVMKMGRAIIIGDAAHTFDAKESEGLNVAICEGYYLGYAFSKFFQTEDVHVITEFVEAAKSHAHMLLMGRPCFGKHPVFAVHDICAPSSEPR